MMWNGEAINDSLPSLDLRLDLGYTFSDEIDEDSSFIKSLVSDELTQEEKPSFTTATIGFMQQFDSSSDEKKITATSRKISERKSDRAFNDSSNNEGKIPRPPNSFMLFAKEYRRIIANANPGRANKEISILLGEAWKKLDDNEKEKYIQEAEFQRKRHRSKYPNYIYSPIEARARKAGKIASKTDEQKSSEVERVDEKKVINSIASEMQSQVTSTTNEVLHFDALQDSFATFATASVDLVCESVPCSTSVESTLDDSRVTQVSTSEKGKVMTEIYIAPPGFEDVEIQGMEKFVAYQGKLIPYSEWTKVSGNVHKLELTSFSDLPNLNIPTVPTESSEIVEPVASDTLLCSADSVDSGISTTGDSLYSLLMDGQELVTSCTGDFSNYGEEFDAGALLSSEDWMSSQFVRQLVNE